MDVFYYLSLKIDLNKELRSRLLLDFEIFVIVDDVVDRSYSLSLFSWWLEKLFLYINWLYIKTLFKRRELKL